MKSARLCNDKQTYYSNGVLVGNWFEERVQRYRKNRYDHLTVYNQDYTAKYARDKKETDDMRNNTKIKSEYGDNISPTKITDDGPNYYDNFTTTYDLSFQYFPEWFNGLINRKMRFRLLKHEPTNEYLNGYGNLSTRNGLTDEKKEKWECDVLDPRRSVSSISKADFTKYGKDFYRPSSYPLRRPIKIKCGVATDLIYQQLPPNHPRRRDSTRNPIIWEGCEEEALAHSCVCKL